MTTQFLSLLRLKRKLLAIHSPFPPFPFGTRNLLRVPEDAHRVHQGKLRQIGSRPSAMVPEELQLLLRPRSPLKLGSLLILGSRACTPNFNYHHTPLTIPPP